MTKRHEQILKDAYQHPYEKFHREENAKRQLGTLIAKEIKKRNEVPVDNGSSHILST